MEAERPEVEAALNRLLASQGYVVRRRPDEHAGGNRAQASVMRAFVSRYKLL
jgi:ABC-type uncharacterized transport system YnjBCD ATPase subunit